MKKVFFIIPSLTGGGAERIVQLVSKNLPREKYSLKIVVFNDTRAYDIPGDIEVVSLHKKRASDFFGLIMRLAQHIDAGQPDIVIGSLTYANFVSIAAVWISKSRPKLIITEHNNLRKDFRTERFYPVRMMLVRLLYPYADRIICVSKGCADDIAGMLGLVRTRIEVIYNPVSLEDIGVLKNESLHHPWFNPKQMPIVISAGRLAKQKGFDILLKAFSLVRQRTQARLLILGDGTELAALRELSNKLNIDKDVSFLGFQENPFNLIKHSEIFVLSSLWEGFGNVIVEAMACGTCVVASDCSFGPGEIITHGINGYLVQPGDEVALSNTLIELLSNQDLRQKMRTAALIRSRDFSVDNIIERYDAVLNDLYLTGPRSPVKH
ncbi:MAG: glycosyltransferase [Candidatus Omnitrophica bacterium]|nr:glycosyltransferase [Candidatus Omnitrophota bacterium]